jgi:hypothetical protein
MALATELAVEAIELESFVEEIPDLQAHFDKLQTRLEKGGKKIQCSFNTNRGGTQRAPFWAGTRVQGGAPIQQFGLGTTAPIGGDTSTAPYVPAWGRGSGSQFVSMCASPVRFVNVCEISNLAQYATDGKERGLVKFSREEMDKSLLAFDNGVEAVLNRDGSGTIDQIPLTATITTGGSGAQTSIIAGINTAASFVDQQQVQFFSGVGGTLRGGAGATATISYVDPVTQTLFFSTALPSGTTQGDIIVIQGATGAAGSSVYGKDYWIQNGNVGTFGGVNIALYPSRFSSPTINFGGSGTIVNSTAQRVQSIRMRAMGDDYDKNEKCFWYANPQQGVSLAGNYYNPGYTRLDEGGNERVPDVAKRYMQDTWAGEEVVWSSTAEPSRMDRIVSDAFYFGELFPTRLHEWTPGNPIAAVPTNDGSGASNAIGTTYYDSQMFAYERSFNLLCPEMRQQFFLQGLPVPSDS